MCIESLHDLFEDDSETNENQDEVENLGKQKPSHQQKNEQINNGQRECKFALIIIIKWEIIYYFFDSSLK